MTYEQASAVIRTLVVVMILVSVLTVVFVMLGLLTFGGSLIIGSLLGLLWLGTFGVWVLWG